MGPSMLVGIIVAFFIYNDAQKRGHTFFSSLLWTVGSVAMPIIIVPLYLMIGRRRNVSDTRDSDPSIIDIEATVVEDTIPCPMCASKVQESFLVCPYCSHTLRPTCPSCGKKLERDEKICSTCQAETGQK
jgi:DNA-directed RNA polymerase subunit RPC12/RpoP